MSDPRLSVVIVTWNSVGTLEPTLTALLEQLRDDDQLIVADNGSGDGTLDLVARLAPGAEIVQTGSNTGFGAAANAGAAAADRELVLFLNPDARPMPGFREAIARPWVQQRGWAAWMGLVVCSGGREVNSAGNPVHFTGLAWAGEHRKPPGGIKAGEVPSLSGACLALPLRGFREVGGFADSLFLYQEDVDLSLRLRLGGGRVGVEPAAAVEHEYEFEGREKMRWLERNRWACVLRTFPGPLLALLTPALLLTELAMLPVAIAGGWGGQKLRANLDGLRRLPQTLRSRRLIQSGRSISAGEFSTWLTPDLDSPYFGGAGRSRLLRTSLRAYWRVVRALLGR